MTEKIIYQGQVFYHPKNLYSLLIFPLIQIKNLFQLLYQFFLKIMWIELIHGQKAENELVSIFFFFLFLFLSWLSFLLKSYVPFLLILFLIIWYIDCGIAQKTYRRGQYDRPLYFREKEDGQIDWSVVLSPQKILHHTFNWGQAREIAIAALEVKGGAFQEELATIWQAKLWLYDGSAWVITEQENLLTVVEAAQKIAIYGECPIIFTDSYGLGKYAEKSIEAGIDFSLENKYWGVKHHQSERKWHIASTWYFRHSWRFIKQVIRDSGFLLFVLIVSSMMVLIGEELNIFIQSFRNQAVVNIEFPNTPNQFLPFWNWHTGLILGIAIATMIYKGWQLSRVKHSFVDHHFLRLSIDNQSIGKIPTAEIESLLLVGETEPRILIVGKNSALVIPKMQRKEDSLLYLTYLQEAVDYFQSLDPKLSQDSQ